MRRLSSDSALTSMRSRLGGPERLLADAADDRGLREHAGGEPDPAPAGAHARLQVLAPRNAGLGISGLTLAVRAKRQLKRGDRARVSRGGVLGQGRRRPSEGGVMLDLQADLLGQVGCGSGPVGWCP
jgi:hypothetical protein